jgi:hypothetical protein
MKVHNKQNDMPAFTFLTSYAGVAVMLQSIEILRGTPVRLTDGFVVLLSHSIQ